MPSNHFILCCPLFLLPSIVPGIRVFSSESVLLIKWPKYWSFSFSISPSNEYSGLISLRLTGLISLQSKGLSRVFSSAIVQKHQFFGVQPSLWSNSHIYTWLPEKPWKYLKYFMETLEIFLPCQLAWCWSCQWRVLEGYWIGRGEKACLL